MNQLLPHNREAADKALAMLKDAGKAAVVHATGTGKSYIGAEVCSHYKKVLMLSPSNHIIDQNMRVMGDNVEAMTYQKLINTKLDQVPAGYDLIYLDEFHHAGADVWGSAIEILIMKNKEAHLFGTSATAIRYSDGMRNMADDIFGGNIASELSLADAINKGILPQPIYVRSLIDFEETYAETMEMIEKSTKSADKEAARIKMNDVAKNWSKSHGVPQILKKYMSEDTKRVIVFCQSVEMASKCKALVEQWFIEAGYRDMRAYHIDSSRRDPQKEIRLFETTKFDGLKIAVSVNMLNEGLHIEGVDCIIMLRQTMSRTVLEQQIGRCVRSGSTKQPLIFDLVNNMENLDMGINLQVDRDGSELKEVRAEYKKREKELMPFNVIDECADIREVIDEMNARFGFVRNYWTVEEARKIISKYTKLRDFVKENKCLAVWIANHGYWTELTGHLEKRVKEKNEKEFYTKEECIEIAKKHKYKSEWKRKHFASYNIAVNNGWIDEIINTRPCCYRIDVDEMFRLAKSCSSYEEFVEKYPVWYRRAKSLCIVKRLRSECYGKEYIEFMTDEELMHEINSKKLPHTHKMWRLALRRGLVKRKTEKK